MKKALVLISVGLMVGSTQAQVVNKRTLHHKIHKAQATKAPVAKDQAPTTTTNNDKIWIDNLSGNFTLASNYMFRGISQTRNLPAAQGSITYTLPYGLYLNMWSSNVRFDNSPATVEIDSVIGVHNTIGDNFTYDISGARYNYPGARLTNYNELNSVFNYYFIQLGLSYSGNVYDTHTNGTYYNGGINYSIPPEYFFHIEDMTIQALIGHYDLHPAAGHSYDDYNIVLSKKIKNYIFTAQWTDTNGRAKSQPYDRSTFIGQVTANF